MEQDDTMISNGFKRAAPPSGESGLKGFIETICKIFGNPEKVAEMLESMKAEGFSFSDQSKENPHNSPTSIAPTATTNQPSHTRQR